MTTTIAIPALTRHDRAPLRVGYILKQYPRLSETFILNEILGVERRGVDVTVFSLRHATEGRFHPAIADVRAPVHYVVDADKHSFLEAMRALPNLQVERLPEFFSFLDLLPPERQARIALCAVEIADRVRRESIDHLHAHFLTVAAHSAHLVHLLTGVPYTVTAHAKDIYRHTVDWRVAARVATSAHQVITVCDANLRFLEHRLDGAGANLARIYNGLGPQDRPGTNAARTPGLILGVGRLVEKKGFDLVLRAVALLAEHRPDISAVIVGDGDQREALEALAVELGIADRVTFTGALAQPDVARWLRQAELMLAPCRVGEDGNQDALPTVLIEALAAGLPAVTTPIAGIPEIIEDGVEGVIVPPDDVAALAAASAALLADHDRRAAMSLAGPRKQATHFDRDRTIELLLRAFGAHDRVGS